MRETLMESMTCSKTAPVWWPEVLAGTRRRRMVTAMLLDHAVVQERDGVLRLVFARSDVAAAWEESGAQAALEDALAHAGHDLTVTAA
ncbi:hypothetical protein [Streptomyces viridosporus]|uniref:hypothetical protein n=1 Tax=Streptomyces viridosporus TaxID=67581 RepID=UPI0001AEF279|nr:hypothetical protein [Streptomyces viridosporus]